MRVLGVAFLAILAAVPAVAGTLEAALEARLRLGPAVWSRVVRIHNDRPEGPYPALVHALVFELGGVLWIYNGTDGTQSFSLHRGRLEEEKADFGPLLLDIEPGFSRHEDLTGQIPLVRRAGLPRDLPNGCFIDAVALYLQRWAGGRAPEQARLLTYYWQAREGLRGHTVLLYQDRGEHWVYDPFADDRPRRWSEPDGADALDVAAELVPSRMRRRLRRAVFLELEPPALSLQEPGRAPARVASAQTETEGREARGDG